jgi:energy-coupling factor transporter ATP-binding protein EcfA2
MRVAKVSVSGLFGLFHHVIPLRHNERITIIHGPNGYGKTIILKMLSGLFNDAISIFGSVPFDEFRVELDEGKAISIRRSAPSAPATKDDVRHRTRGRPHSAPEIVAHFSGPGAPAKPVVLSQLRRKLRGVPSEVLMQAIDGNFPLVRMGPETWRDYETNEILTLDEIMDRYGPHLSRIVGQFPHRADDQSRDGEDAWFSEIKTAIPIRLIQTKRLDVIEPGARDPRSSQRVATVKKYSDEVAERIKVVLAAYAARAQDLDRSFPQRLFSQQGALLSVETLGKRLAELEEKRARLTALGFLDAEQYLQPASEQAVAAKRDVLSVYAGDVEQKLAVFDEMANKIDLLTRIVNSRFLYKRMSISRESGFVFESETGSRLSPVDLSSGEQHELVLLYELLFKLKANSLVLIDEPEISLHPEWQEKFLGDLLEMVQLSDFDVLLATHSPEIIGSHMNLATELVGPPRPLAPPSAQR